MRVLKSQSEQLVKAHASKGCPRSSYVQEIQFEDSHTMDKYLSLSVSFSDLEEGSTFGFELKKGFVYDLKTGKSVPSLTSLMREPEKDMPEIYSKFLKAAREIPDLDMTNDEIRAEIPDLSRLEFHLSEDGLVFLHPFQAPALNSTDILIKWKGMDSVFTFFKKPRPFLAPE